MHTATVSASLQQGKPREHSRKPASSRTTVSASLGCGRQSPWTFKKQLLGPQDGVFDETHCNRAARPWASLSMVSRPNGSHPSNSGKTASCLKALCCRMGAVADVDASCRRIVFQRNEQPHQGKVLSANSVSCVVPVAASNGTAFQRRWSASPNRNAITSSGRIIVISKARKESCVGPSLAPLGGTPIPTSKKSGARLSGARALAFWASARRTTNPQESGGQSTGSSPHGNVQFQ